MLIMLVIHQQIDMLLILKIDKKSKKRIPEANANEGKCSFPFKNSKKVLIFHLVFLVKKVNGVLLNLIKI